MSRRYVQTPGGDTVEVLDDAEWIARHGDAGDPHTLTRMWSMRAPVLEALFLDGPAKDASGRAAAVLHKRAAVRGYSGNAVALTNLLGRGTVSPTVERETRGRRTYRIALVALPETWLARIEPLRPKVVEAPVEAPVEEVAAEAPELDERDPEYAVGAVLAQVEDLDPVDAAAVLDEAKTGLLGVEVAKAARGEESRYVAPDAPLLPPVDLDDEPAGLQVAGVVAMELLTRVVEIISAGTYNGAERRLREERDDARARLHERTEYAERLRRENRSLGEDLAAVRHERDGLRRRLSDTETNLRKALSADTNEYVRERVQRELDRVMRATPSSKVDV